MHDCEQDKQQYCVYVWQLIIFHFWGPTHNFQFFYRSLHFLLRITLGFFPPCFHILCVFFDFIL